MPNIKFISIQNSQKSAHNTVLINGHDAGEVWREQVNVPVKIGSTHKTLKWRWFSRRLGETTTLGKGTRTAMIIGAGFTSRNEATNALCLGREDQFNAPNGTSYGN